MKQLILIAVALVTGYASAETVMTCKIKDSATFLVLTENTVELIDPTALRPLSHLNLWNGQLTQGASIIAVDHWESHTGEMQLVAVFPVGGWKAEHVYFKASWARDTNNGGSYGLMELARASAAEWTCER